MTSSAQPTDQPAPTAPNTARGSRLNSGFRLLVTLILLVSGVVLGGGGIMLAAEGGTWYYLWAGTGYVICALLLLLRVRITGLLATLLFIATVYWAINDAPNFGFWTLVPRIGAPALLLLLTLWCSALLANVHRVAKWLQLVLTAVLFLGLLAVFISGFYTHGRIELDTPIAQRSLLPDQTTDWRAVGRDNNGSRFIPYQQITPDNVNQLEQAWHYHDSRDSQQAGHTRDATPLQVGNTLYTCTAAHLMTAIDATTGKPKWQFSPEQSSHTSCHTLGYYDTTQDTSLSPQQRKAVDGKQCQQQLFAVEGSRLFAVDANTGKSCGGFGDNGSVNLATDRDTDNPRGLAAPLIAGHLIITSALGGGDSTVHAIDARNGQQVWQWEGLNAQQQDADGGPHVTTSATFDGDLNAVYLTTNSGRPAASAKQDNDVQKRFGSAIVALDAATGELKWSFQTVHHDVWGYGVNSHPVLTDIDNANQRTLPALIQTTSTGNIFILDRQTGSPIESVEERSAPELTQQGSNVLAATQPYTGTMPQLQGARLADNTMWGLTPFDQLSCRLQLQHSSYEGNYTPPAGRSNIQYPAANNMSSVKGVSLDPTRRLLFVNSSHMAAKTVRDKEGHERYTEQLTSALGVPCVTPPMGTLSAINVDSHKLVWQVPIGTTLNAGPFGLHSKIPMPVGMPNSGAPTSTASGLVFFAGADDNYLRALDATSGKVIWRERLPGKAVSAPVSFVSPEDHRQYVVVATKEHHTREAHVVAFALPRQDR
ncbi:outer membrane protein assembly factor BamB family protein [Carnimonas bestiolae]|uniref:outer membrane protein assembly factor BamB family protein n=1 Tax=Carnimonas bestiolae TaxID=3402172 RepID=UPI003EDC605B